MLVTEMFRNAAKALLAVLFTVCVYRAFTQSLVYDEALTHELYVAGPLGNLFYYFSPNHHFLNSLLMRLSAAVFGESEWALRLPALAGAVLYFVAVYRIAAVAFGEGGTFLLAVALLSLNPFVLDFMVAARGYGLALALLMFAIALLLECFLGHAIVSSKLALAGAALALSVTAQLVFVLPAAAVFGLAWYLLPNQPAPAAGPPKLRKKRDQRNAGIALWVWLAAPIAGIALLFFLLFPFDTMRAAQFYTGAATLTESLRSLASTSLQHSGPLRFAPGMAVWRDIVAFGIGPAVAGAALVLGVIRRNVLLLFASGPVVFSAGALLLMHLLLGSPYPADRTGLYFAPLVCLGLAGLPLTMRRFAAPCYFIAAIFVVQFAGEFNTRKFYVWEYDADTRSMGEYMSQHHQGSGTVRVGGSWQLSQSLAYYLFRNQWAWMEIERRAPEPGYDYYAFLPQDTLAVQAMGLSVVYHGPVSGSVLAVPSK